jgi:dihydroneopterin triphosphate diphosphatase
VNEPRRFELKIRSSSVSVIAIRTIAGTPHYLIMRRATDYLRGQWCQVAGAVEPDETAWQAALRELREETGLEPLSLYSADRFEQFYRPDWDALVFVPLFVAFLSPDAEVLLNREHSEYRWCSRDEALSLLPFFNQRANISHVHAEFVDRPPNELLRITTESA